jgi:hypothetical protein
LAILNLLYYPLIIFDVAIYKTETAKRKKKKDENKNMFATRSLLHSCRITLFSRDNCGLCSQAKSVLSEVWDKRPFAYKEVDLAKPESEPWRNLYDFDIPVVCVTWFYKLSGSFFLPKD